MELKAKDVMITDFETISPDAPIKQAIKRIYHGRIRPTGHRTVSIMVTDDLGNLVGKISMFDILYHFRPPMLDYGLDSIAVWKGDIEPYLKQFEGLTVGQLMTPPSMCLSPDDHIMVIIDGLIKKKSRRMPVIDGSKLVGVVYIADVYSHLFRTWL